jgi:hypothetical protein
MRRRELICGLCTAALWKGIASVSNQENPVALRASPKLEPLPSPVAGIRLIDTQLGKAATELARDVSPPYLFHHAVRTFLFASLTGRARGQRFDEEVLYLACILHDLGLTDRFEGNLPFEIQGAQAARYFLDKHGFDSTKAIIVWDGIAMHSSQIGQFKQPEVSLVGIGAGTDALGPDLSEIKNSDVQEIVTAYPRLGFKEAFVKTCAEVVRKHPDGAAHSFMRDVGERQVSNYHPRNICDLIAQAPFSE